MLKEKERLYKGISLSNNKTVYGYYIKIQQDCYIVEKTNSKYNINIIKIDSDTLQQSIRIKR